MPLETIPPTHVWLNVHSPPMLISPVDFVSIHVHQVISICKWLSLIWIEHVLPFVRMASILTPIPSSVQITQQIALMVSLQIPTPTNVKGPALKTVKLDKILQEPASLPAQQDLPIGPIKYVWISAQLTHQCSLELILKSVFLPVILPPLDYLVMNKLIELVLILVPVHL